MMDAQGGEYCKGVRYLLLGQIAAALVNANVDRLPCFFLRRLWYRKSMRSLRK